jgi:sugar/nucleoside kinase (ribokinase family)
MSYDIVTIGSMHCEIMRKELDQPLNIPADFTGPYPSGDPAIMIYAAAKLGAKCGMISVVGEDAFGRCVTARLEQAGVDCSMVRKDSNSSTGAAFVCYYADGSRDFLFHVERAASGGLTPEDVNVEKLTGTKWINISGFTIMLGESCRNAVYKIINELPEGTAISFDPNVRLESSEAKRIKEYCAPVIEKASIIFPSKNEAAIFTDSDNDDMGCRKWAAMGKTVVLKNGESGCRIYVKDQVIIVPSVQVEEVDPTGAGDTFCGAFLTALTNGKSLEECGKFANMAGALSVRVKGPMEGAPSRDEVEEYLKNV